MTDALHYRLPPRLSAALKVAEHQKRAAIADAFTELAPAFEHLGITVTCKGKKEPVWTLKSAGKVVKVSADGTVEVVK